MNAQKQSIKRTKAIATLAVTLISAGAIAGPAVAETTVFSGNMCQPTVSSDVAKLSSGGNNIFNFSSTAATVNCPMTQRFPSDQNKTSTRSSIRLFKFNNQQVSCTLFSSDAFGGTLGSSNVKTSSSSNTTITTSFVPKGHYYGLSCTLPPGSGIAFYDLL